MKKIISVCIYVFLLLTTSAMSHEKIKDSTSTSASEKLKAEFTESENYVLKHSPFLKDFDKSILNTDLNDLATRLVKQETTRKPSGSDVKIDLSQMSSELKTFYDDFLKIKSGDDLIHFINQQDEQYDKYKNDDVRYAVANICLLRPFQGIVWRLIKILDKSKALHSFVLTLAKRMASGVSVYLPTNQWEAGFQYVSQPYIIKNYDSKRKNWNKEKLLTQFNTEEEIQVFFANTVLSELRVAIERISNLNFSQRLMLFDNQLIYGKKSFEMHTIETDRYRQIGELERITLLASLHLAVSRISAMRMYSVTNGLSVSKSLGNLYGWDGFSVFDTSTESNQSEVSGVTAKNIFDVYAKYPNFGKLLRDAETWADSSFQNLKRAEFYITNAWSIVKKRPQSEAWLFNTAILSSNQRINDERLRNFQKLASGKEEEIYDHTYNEKVLVNYSQLFKKPLVENLREFLATKYENNNSKRTEWLEKELTVDGKKIKTRYRNFFNGRGEEWKYDVYERFFPSIKNLNNPVDKKNELKRSARVLSQSWGTWLISVPLMEAFR
ncbi:MAG: hypothetical protein J0M15_05485 [Deltaproteobacteria bacterium]|nr:hypothetical protein [Deltaproteobacteria bacterium]